MGIFGQISILNRKDLWNDISDFTGIGIKFQPNDKNFSNNFLNVLTPLRENRGQKRKTLKMGHFRPKKIKMLTKKGFNPICHDESIKR